MLKMQTELQFEMKHHFPAILVRCLYPFKKQ